MGKNNPRKRAEDIRGRLSQQSKIEGLRSFAECIIPLLRDQEICLTNKDRFVLIYLWYLIEHLLSDNYSLIQDIFKFRISDHSEESFRAFLKEIDETAPYLTSKLNIADLLKDGRFSKDDLDTFLENFANELVQLNLDSASETTEKIEAGASESGTIKLANVHLAYYKNTFSGLMEALCTHNKTREIFLISREISIFLLMQAISEGKNCKYSVLINELSEFIKRALGTDDNVSKVQRALITADCFKAIFPMFYSQDLRYFAYLNISATYRELFSEFFNNLSSNPFCFDNVSSELKEAFYATMSRLHRKIENEFFCVNDPNNAFQFFHCLYLLNPLFKHPLPEKEKKKD